MRNKIITSFFCLLLAAWMIVLAATGQTARFVRETAADGYSAEA